MQAGSDKVSGTLIVPHPFGQVLLEFTCSKYGMRCSLSLQIVIASELPVVRMADDEWRTLDARQTKPIT
jgi:hypothetical protein